MGTARLVAWGTSNPRPVGTTRQSGDAMKLNSRFLFISSHIREVRKQGARYSKSRTKQECNSQQELQTFCPNLQVGPKVSALGTLRVNIPVKRVALVVRGAQYCLKYTIHVFT